MVILSTMLLRYKTHFKRYKQGIKLSQNIAKALYLQGFIYLPNILSWFMYWLKADNEAGNVFFGEEAEIISNSNWQDVKKNH